MNERIKLNIPWMKENGLIVQEYAEGIWWIENFLTPEVQQEFVHFAEQIPEPEWKMAYMKHLETVADTLYGSKDIIHLIATKQITDFDMFFNHYDRLHDNGANLWGFKYDTWLDERWSNIFLIEDQEDINKIEIDWALIVERRHKGWGTPVHIDNDESGMLLYATILYANDNFVGGKLAFPEKNIVIEPKAGALCVFDASFNYRHEVTPVTEGIRYSMPIFVWDITKAGDYRKLHK